MKEQIFYDHNPATCYRIYNKVKACYLPGYPYESVQSALEGLQSLLHSDSLKEYSTADFSISEYYGSQFVKTVY